MELSKERLEVVKKIEELEAKGDFLTDVENDPPYHFLKPGEVDYKRRKLSSKIKSRFADFYSFRFFNGLIRKGAIVIDAYLGIDNLTSLKSGAVVTANHFNAFDSIAIHKVCKRFNRKRQLYKVIKEGNYSFPGIFGFFMRNCYSLPLAKDPKVMREMIDGVDYVLQKGNLLLVYAEQSMWWNYRKPKPYQTGAFNFAVRNNVPVLPMFTTMRDTDTVGPDGFKIQAYTLHILEPIYPDPSLSNKENIKMMKEKNEAMVKEVYEKTYNMPLKYSFEENK